MTAVRRLVLDILKPHDPSLLAFTEQVTGLDGVDGATTSLIELDKEVQNIELTLEGADLDLDAIQSEIEALGGTVHSVDQVACGEYVVEDRWSRQDI
jgi:hypothetical protein